MRASAAFLVLLVLATSPLTAADKSTAGEFITEPATLISLGFEWRIDGDDNRNARVEVSYRKQGEQTWKTGPPLLRIGNERINENALQYVTPNGFAGSVFELEPVGERTRLRLTSTGYPDSEGGRALLAFFEAGNAETLEALQKLFAGDAAAGE